MLVDAILKDAEAGPGATAFTIYLYFLCWILGAANLGTIFQTNGKLWYYVTQLCDGLNQCFNYGDVPVWGGPSNPEIPASWQVFLPCEEMKSALTSLLGLGIPAFILLFFIFVAQTCIRSDRSWTNVQSAVYNVTALVALILTAVEAFTILSLHLSPMCVFPTQEARGKLAIRHAMRDMELGPTFTLMMTSALLQTVALVWTNRRALRGVFAICGDCGGFQARLERAQLAEAKRKNKRFETLPSADLAVLQGYKDGAALLEPASGNGGSVNVNPSDNVTPSVSIDL